MESAPKPTRSEKYLAGFSTIRWTSKCKSEIFRRFARIMGPNVMGSTKCPSIMSICSPSAPQDSASLTWSPKFEKSAARIEGWILMLLKFITFKFRSHIGKGSDDPGWCCTTKYVTWFQRIMDIDVKDIFFKHFWKRPHTFKNAERNNFRIVRMSLAEN